jgi:putative ABC transport system permease protein
MHLGEALVAALRSMRIAPLRTTLTACGIVLGITAVLALVGFTTGLRDGFSATFGDLSRAVLISKNAPRVPGEAAVPLRESDIRALTAPGAAPAIDPDSVMPLRSGKAVLRFRDHQYRALVGGTSPGYLPVRNRTIAAGRMFTEQENADKERVIVLGTDVVNALFQGDMNAAIGSRVYVGRLSMKVIGVLAAAGQDQDLLSLAPVNAVRSLFAGTDMLNNIGFMAVSADKVETAVNQANQILDPLHKVRDAGQRDYTAQTNVVQLQRVATYIALIKWFTLAVAGIALFIGGLGVANIMVITVAERTHEIGVRKALGARRSAIMRQFLIEAMALAGLGGLGGVGLGVALVLAGRTLLPMYAPGYGVPQLSWTAAFAAFGVSLGIGLVAGGYPAFRAARMHPIDALRY